MKNPKDEVKKEKTLEDYIIERNPNFLNEFKAICKEAEKGGTGGYERAGEFLAKQLFKRRTSGVVPRCNVRVIENHMEY